MEIQRSLLAGWLCLAVVIVPVASEVSVSLVQSLDGAAPAFQPEKFVVVRGDYSLTETAPGGVELGESASVSPGPEVHTTYRNYGVRTTQGRVFLDQKDEYELGESLGSAPSLKQMASKEIELEKVQETEELKASTATLTSQIKRREAERASPAAGAALKLKLGREVEQLKQKRRETQVAEVMKLSHENVASAEAALGKVKQEGVLLKQRLQTAKDKKIVKADVSMGGPPPLEQNQHLITNYETRGHQYCKNKVFTTSLASSSDQAVPRCRQCIDNNHFLVPDSNHAAATVGICYPIASYSRWIDADDKAKHDAELRMFCAKFSTKKGATFKQKGGKYTKEFKFEEPDANPDAFGFICSAASRQTETATYSTWDNADGLYRLRVFSYATARFTECHTGNTASRDLTCVKRKVLGSCRQYSAGSDERLHLKTYGKPFALLPVSDTFGQSALMPHGRRETEEEWSARASRHAKGVFAKYRGVNAVERANQDDGTPYDTEQFDFIGGEYGLAKCSRSWKERLVGLL